MSVSAVSSNQYAYLDQQVEGGGNYTYSPAQSTGTSTGDAATTDPISFFGEDGFGFDDFIDIINPFQHIPVISNIYREITGDELSPGSRLIGGGLFGGGIGLAASVINTAVEAETGKDIGGHVIAMFSSDDAPDGTETIQLAKDMAPVPTATPAALTEAVTTSPLIAQQASLSSAATEPAKTNAVPLAMGLQWKGKAPNLQQNIEQARTLHEDNLTPDQLSKVLNSFKIGAPATPGPAQILPKQISDLGTVQKATSSYEKQASATPNTHVSHTESYSYLDQMI
ncbi:MAG: hypothetical protein V7740_14320 [Pseudomonas marincola]